MKRVVSIWDNQNVSERNVILMNPSVELFEGHLFEDIWHDSRDPF